MALIIRQLAILSGALMLFVGSASAQKLYGPGVSDTEIKIGNIMPYSGPASAYGIIGKTMSAYFRMINDNGGINGRKINFISYDDGYSPPKAVEQARRLVESDEVLLVFAPLGTASNAAIQKYMNTMRVPQLFVLSGASRWGEPEHFPWTIGLQPNYRAEARVYATYILEQYPNAKIGILYQNDDFGRDYMAGLKDVLRDKYDRMVIASTPYETSTPTVDSLVVAIKTANPDIFLNIATSKFAAQAIKKIAELNWHPIHILTNISVSVGAVLRPAGLDNAKGILSAGFQMDVTDPQWDGQPGMQRFRTFMARYYPEADRSEGGPMVAFNASSALVEVLKRCGDNVTRENVMKVVTDLDFEIDTLVPGIRIKTSTTDFYPIEQFRMMRFTGEWWELFGPILDGHVER
ncbi:branched-chain amino acid transport system substrate-binding protein [Bradyrhizobium macuxiense]|uniref:Branched-chain amino acid transport system substrate-binding protein n=1 Tax=Bradyrhizobium macuxiense TaxID=1755647 RepID=A0A560LD75_9BRAD|nr:ABC transporter substrate-binding protein [Bradyrhizobium macuxiense]TWB93528.1 branched-chain amino acid transport system substrate-binding protein [Bradyrhizobium macuxiense]